jgi:NAD(P)-dependent dehydrogenase (short-subunit alcohol dehydrogenase family)
MKHLLVIGGNTGIGFEFVKSARQWYRQNLTYVPKPDELDVTDEHSIDLYLQRISHGKHPFEIDVAYFAGYNRLMALPDLNPASLRHHFDVNVTGFILLVGAMAKHWGQTHVSIAAVASDAARIPMRNSIAYCASKAALVMAVRVAAREMAPTWRVNCVSPGIVAGTPMTEYIDREVTKQRGWTDEQAADYERSMIPMGRRATKAEIGDLILSTLHGPEYLTGANLEINGGK